MNKQIIWLTGASSGIGKEVALEFARRGAIVALTARRREMLEHLVEEIHALGGAAYSYPGDVTDLARMREISQQIESNIGPIAIVIANAGFHIPTFPEKFDSSEYKATFDINFNGMLHVFEAVLPYMIKRQAGHVVATSSVAGFRGLPTAAAYGASKSAMTHFLESMRFHLKRQHIPVTIIKPGFVRTPMTENNRFYMPFVMDAGKAAQIICDGIEQQKNEIIFPKFFTTLLKIMRVIPYPLYEVIVELGWKLSGLKFTESPKGSS